MKKYKVVFWDFDGVWSKDRFYKSLENTHPNVYEFIQTKVFGGYNDGRVDKWMRAELNMNDINNFVAQETGTNFDLLTKTFIDDVGQMIIEMRHIPIVEALKKQDIKVGMITNNMDVFEIVTRPRLKFDELFNGKVFCSFTYKKMKADGLYDIAMQSIGEVDYSTTLLIDDSPRARAAFEEKGGQTYAYTTFEDFKIWADQNLLNKESLINEIKI